MKTTRDICRGLFRYCKRKPGLLRLLGDHHCVSHTCPKNPTGLPGKPAGFDVFAYAKKARLKRRVHSNTINEGVVCKCAGFCLKVLDVRRNCTPRCDLGNSVYRLATSTTPLLSETLAFSIHRNYSIQYFDQVFTRNSLTSRIVL